MSPLLAVRTMARYEHVPIYKAAMDLTVYLEQAVRNFSRYHKYTLGSGVAAAEPGAGDIDYPGEFPAGE